MQYEVDIKKSVWVVLDSLATPEQMDLKQALNNILYGKVAIENNEFVLTLNRAYFNEQNIPDFYYDLLRYNFQETSDALKKQKEIGTLPTEQTDLEILYESAKKEYWDRQGEK